MPPRHGRHVHGPEKLEIVGTDQRDRLSAQPAPSSFGEAKVDSAPSALVRKEEAVPPGPGQVANRHTALTPGECVGPGLGGRQRPGDERDGGERTGRTSGTVCHTPSEPRQRRRRLVRRRHAAEPGPPALRPRPWPTLLDLLAHRVPGSFDFEQLHEVGPPAEGEPYGQPVDQPGALQDQDDRVKAGMVSRSEPPCGRSGSGCPGSDRCGAGGQARARHAQRGRPGRHRKHDAQIRPIRSP